MLKLLWTRNSEPDMKAYKVYACFTVGCVVTKQPALLQATVPHPPPGVVPEWLLPADTVGTVALTAVDNAGNEGALSVALPFDTVTPAAPTGLQFQ